MKNSTEKFPGDAANLANRGTMTRSAYSGKGGYRLAYLILVVTLAGLHNAGAAGRENVELFAVKERPVKVAAFQQAGEADRNGNEATGNQFIHGSPKGFIKLLLEEIKTAAPGQKTPKQIDEKTNQNPILTELNTNINNLCHTLLAYFITAVMFLTTFLALLFSWVRSSLQTNRITQHYFNTITRGLDKINQAETDGTDGTDWRDK